MTKPKHQPRMTIGPLSVKGTGRHFAVQRVEFPPSDRITNAGASGTYSAQPDLCYRGQGARLPSRGAGC